MWCFSTSAMKSAGVYRANADLQKCGLDDRKFSGPQWRFVKLHRPPPEIRIFFPARSACSSSATRRPRLPASMAHINPAAPAPRTIASNSWITYQLYRTNESRLVPGVESVEGDGPGFTIIRGLLPE